MAKSSQRVRYGVSVLLAATLAGLGVPSISLAASGSRSVSDDLAISLMSEESYIEVSNEGSSYPFYPSTSVTRVSSDVSEKLVPTLVQSSTGTGSTSTPLEGVTWSSSDSSVLDVDTDGTISGKGKAGFVVITVSDTNGHSARIPFEVATPQQLLEELLEELPSQSRYSGANEFVIDGSWFQGKTSTYLNANFAPSCSFSGYSSVTCEASIADAQIATAVFKNSIIELALSGAGADSSLHCTTRRKGWSCTVVRSGSRRSVW